MKVVLAHTQKPPYESRIYDKLAYSISHFNNLEIHILGGNKFETGELDEIKLIPLFCTKRGLKHRLYNVWKCWFLLLKIKPELVIICSPDLLLPAVMYKLIYGKRLIFDVQENFGLNLRFQAGYKILNRINLQQISELYFSWFFPFIDRFWLAEKIYLAQLGLSEKASGVFENKVSAKWLKQKSENLLYSDSDESCRFLFSGIITEESGILRAIDFYLAYNFYYSESEFIISGYIPNQDLQSKIQSFANQSQGIEVLDEGKWATISTVFDQFSKSDVVFLSYNETKANEGKVPSKFFEAQFMGKPVLCQKNGSFSKLILESKSGFEVDFQNTGTNDFVRLNEQIKSFVPTNKFSLEFVFDSEGLRADFLCFCERFSLKF